MVNEIPGSVWLLLVSSYSHDDPIYICHLYYRLVNIDGQPCSRPKGQHLCHTCLFNVIVEVKLTFTISVSTTFVYRVAVFLILKTFVYCNI